MEPTPHKQPVRFYEIDLLRFLAALSVVLYHYTYRGFAQGNYSPVPYLAMGRFTRYGYLGVELFFIISGYVVLLSAQGKTVRQFFISRVTRLYPAFWAACTLTFLVERVWGSNPADPRMSFFLHAGFKQYLYNMTMLPEFFGKQVLDGSYWSLTIEITFYFLVSLLIAYQLMRHIDLVLAGWLLYVAAAGAAPTATPLAELFFPRYAPCFVAGMLFYLLQPPQGRTWLRYGLLLASYLLAVRAGITQAHELSGYYHDSFSSLVEVSAITAFYGLFFLVTFRKISLGQRSWLAWLGALTYPLYLVHQHIGFVAFHRLGHLADKYVLLGSLLVGMLALAYLLHVLVEKPLSKPLGAFVDRWLTYLSLRSAPASQPTIATPQPAKATLQPQA